MRRWIGFWLSGWRSEPVEFVSPLSAPEVRAALREGSTSYLRAALWYGGGRGYRVVGRVGEHRVTLEAGRAGVRNSWRPVLHGRLEPAGTGCRLTGRLGWSSVVKAISGLWLGVVCCVFIGLVGQGAGFLACLAPLGFAVFFVLLTAWGMRAGRDDAKYLRSWLARCLRTADAGIAGYRPWPGNEPL